MDITTLQKELKQHIGLIRTWNTVSFNAFDADDIVSDALLRGIETGITNPTQLIIDAMRAQQIEENKLRCIMKRVEKISDSSNQNFFLQAEQLSHRKRKVHDYPQDFIRLLTPMMQKYLELQHLSIDDICFTMDKKYSNVVTSYYRIRQLWKQFRAQKNLEIPELLNGQPPLGWPAKRKRGWPKGQKRVP